VLYQDRLSDEQGGIDGSVSWSLGAVEAPDGQTTGVVLIAFDHTGLNAAVRGKLRKGAAVTLFFVALILVQNVASRRAKLRMAELERTRRGLERALAQLQPVGLPSLPGLDVGRVYDRGALPLGLLDELRVVRGALQLLVIAPSAESEEGAGASLALLAAWRATSEEAPLEERLRQALGAAATKVSPGAVGLFALELGRDGAVDGYVSGMARPVRLAAAGAPVPLLPVDTAGAPLGSALLVEPLVRVTGEPSPAPLVWAHEGPARPTPMVPALREVSARLVQPAQDALGWAARLGALKLPSPNADRLIVVAAPSAGEPRDG
jgi:hypothetical protein